MSYFYIDRNACYRVWVHNSLSEAQAAIKEAKEKCTNSDYLNIKQKIAELEEDFLTETGLSDRIKNLESEAKRSKFYVNFEEKLEILKLFIDDDD